MNVQIPVKWLQELLALCGPEDHELRERVMVSITAMDEQAAAPVVLPEPFTTLVRKNSWSPSCYEASPRSNSQEYGRQWADERINVYTEQQVRALLAGISAPAAVAAPAAQSVANADGRFTKNPVTIDAIKWTGSNLREVIAFTDGPPDTRSIHAGMAWEAYVDLVARDGLKIYTLEGKMLANIGDWIIRGIKGEYYPCKPDIFEATYTSAPQAQEKGDRDE